MTKKLQQWNVENDKKKLEIGNQWQKLAKSNETKNDWAGKSKGRNDYMKLQ